MSGAINRTPTTAGQLTMPNGRALDHETNSHFRRLKDAYVGAGLLIAAESDTDVPMQRSDSAYELSSEVKQGPAKIAATVALTPPVDRALKDLAKVPDRLRAQSFPNFWVKVLHQGVGAPNARALERDALMVAVARGLVHLPSIFVA